MTGREWQPGDVAMVTVRGKELFCTFYDTGSERGWFHGLGYVSNHYVAEEREAVVRPLVVIDPEDREQVERLTEAWLGAFYDKSGETHLNKVEAMQAALREFANPTPPRPEEPTGLGAVVEDAEGGRWVRIDSDDYPWYEPESRDFSTYRAVAAVRVLSEGVTA